MLFRQKLSAYIKEKALFKKEDLLVVALSGGPDSIALTDALYKLGYHFEAAHCNFHLRGDESERDEAFVRHFCKERDICLNVKSFHTADAASKEGISIEMAARKQRYAWFKELLKEREAQCILTAHHKDDSIETILLNLVRGTGIEGLTGISPLSGDLRRPLLCMERKEIMGYILEEHLEYVTDSTNDEDFCKRNIIRHHLVPVLEKLNPSFRSSILSTARNLQETLKVYKAGISDGISRVLDNGDILKEPLLREPSPESILHEALKDKGFNSSQILDLARDILGPSGHQYHSPTHTILRDRDRLIITEREGNDDLGHAPKIRVEEMDSAGISQWPDPRKAVLIDKDLLNGEMALRKARAGDWFIPLGMKGRKLLSDYMTDRKFPLTKKQGQYVLTSGEDIVWIVGERLDDRYKVTDRTQKALVISLES